MITFYIDRITSEHNFLDKNSNVNEIFTYSFFNLYDNKTSIMQIVHYSYF